MRTTGDVTADAHRRRRRRLQRGAGTDAHGSTPDAERLIERIAIGACLLDPAGGLALADIDALDPDLMLWLGDNVYADRMAGSRATWPGCVASISASARTTGSGHVEQVVRCSELAPPV